MNKQGEHTPGPWRVEEFNSASCRKVEAIVSNVGYIVHPELGVCGENWESVEANTRLICGAPALLVACKAALDALRDAEGGDYFNAAKLETMLETAIEAAQGEGV